MSSDDWCFVAKSGGVSRYYTYRTLARVVRHVSKHFYPSQRVVIYDRDGNQVAVRKQGAARFKLPLYRGGNRVLVSK